MKKKKKNKICYKTNNPFINSDHIQHTAYYITTLPPQLVQSRREWFIISPLATSVIALVTYCRYVVGGI